MLSTRRLACAVLLLGLAAGSARGQDAVAPLPGARLRVTAPPVAAGPIVGTLVQITEREVILAVSDSDRRIVPRANIQRVECSRGRHGHALKGLLVGAAVGAVALSAINASDPETGEVQEYILVALVGAGMGALPGAGVGALIKTERWAELPVGNLRVTAEANPKRGFGLRLAWAW